MYMCTSTCQLGGRACRIRLLHPWQAQFVLLLEGLIVVLLLCCLLLQWAMVRASGTHGLVSESICHVYAGPIRTLQ
jgi:hypothetical protein